MKAFSDNGHLSSQQKTFNYRLGRARVVVEHRYGRLKGRWRCLLKRLDVNVCDASELVAACCVLRIHICKILGMHSTKNGWTELRDESVGVLQVVRPLFSKKEVQSTSEKLSCRTLIVKT